MQPNLFQILDQAPTPGRARRRDPDTSKKAAAAAPVAELEARVLRALKITHAGLTTHELAWLLKVDLVSVSPRMRPLAEKGLVEDSGERRRGDSGRQSIVWKAAA
jgi:predicted transcriptional regulator